LALISSSLLSPAQAVGLFHFNRRPRATWPAVCTSQGPAFLPRSISGHSRGLSGVISDVIHESIGGPYGAFLRSVKTMPVQPDDDKLVDPEVQARLSETTKASWSDSEGVRRVLPDQRQTFNGRVTALIAALTADLAGDAGDDALTQTERSLISMAATLTARAEMLQAALLRGDAVDDDTIVRVNNAAARMLDKLGVKIRKQESKVEVPWVTGYDIEKAK
jgi:hypothetical protein